MTRIHDLVHQGQLPQNLVNKNIWEERYEQINNWEKYLRQNGFMMIKIFLHVSKEAAEAPDRPYREPAEKLEILDVGYQ